MCWGYIEHRPELAAAWSKMNRQKRAEILQQQAAVQTKLSDAAQEQAVLFTANVANVWDAVEKAAKEERIAAAKVCNTFTTSPI